LLVLLPAGCETSSLRGDDSFAEAAADADSATSPDAAPDRDTDGRTDAHGDAEGTPDGEGETGEPDDGTSGPDEDACDPGEATEPDDGGGDADAEAGEPPLFDMDVIGDVAAASCLFSDHRTALADLTLLEVWSLEYDSIEVIDGAEHTIRMRGFAAKPNGATGLPGIVTAHGLGGYAQESDATVLAAKVGAFVIAYTGPGGGTDPANTSEGLPATYDGWHRVFDTVPDYRGSWFWAHAAAGMRAVTCLQSREDVDPARLGITGFSAGGIVSLLAAGVDRRLGASVPVSGALRWDVAMESPTSWEHDLLAQAGCTTADEEWIRMLEWLDADDRLGGTSAAVLMIDGSCDEFFPLTAYLATFGALPPGPHRMSLVANYDHGCYGAAGVEDASTIEARADLHIRGGQRAWFRHAFGMDARYACMPATPTVAVAPSGGSTIVAVTADTSCPRLPVENVRAWFSGDNALSFYGLDLDSYGGGVYGGTVPFVLPDMAITYADVQYRTDDLLLPEDFVLSSEPILPSGLVPAIRTMADCLPP
jgi:cephalosporin-C deacetylase-like acetyl esterase